LSLLRVTIAVGDDGLAVRIASALAARGATLTREPDAAAVAARSGEQAPDVLIISCDPDSQEGLARLRVLARQLPSSHLVVLAPSLGPVAVRRAVDAGADGVLSADADHEGLAAVVRAVCAGQVCVPRELGRHVPKPALSHRERQVLGMLAMGATNNEIALRLHLAESTVKSHISSTFAKLGVRSRAQAAMLVLDPEGALGPGILAISGASGSNGAPE
jgi:DNA-binding NarL/FixJ family response regulator